MLKFLRRLFSTPRTRTLYIIRGISGSGKSTLASALTRHNVAADNMPGLYVNGIYQFGLQQNSHRWCESQVERWMRQGKSTIGVHNTNTKRKYYESYINMAHHYGYVVQVIHAEAVILPDGSSPGNVHGVTEEILDRQRSSWEAHHAAG